MVEKRFVIPVERRWTLFILPVLALLYFLAIVTLAALNYEIAGVPMDYLVLGGAALFGVALLVELLLLLRRKVKPAPDAPVEETLAAEPVQDVPVAPVHRDVIRDDEYRRTTQSAQGLQVLEYSWPGKSLNRGAVYAKTAVPVTKEHLLHVETLAAQPYEL